MQFDIQYLFNTLGSGLLAVCLYLFNRVTVLEKRVQSLEDIHTIKIDQVAEKLDKLEKELKDLSYNIHKEKNQEHQLNLTLQAILRKLNEDDN